MTPDQETKCRVVAEKIMGWVPATEWAGGTEVVGWIDPTRHHRDLFQPKDVLLTGNGMVEGVKAIQNDEGIVSFTARPDGTVQCIISLSKKRGMTEGYGNDMPASFLNAAYELVKDDG